ncbi:MAG: peptidoglycan DD-metalloendopeptidase family protein [Chloroflexota bacterium]
MTIAPRLWLSLLAVAGVVAFLAIAAGNASADSQQPIFLLPWQNGQMWVTGSEGFHYTNDAIDFFPPDSPSSYEVHCEGDPDWVFLESSYWDLAAAAGTVTYAEPPYVLIDHGGGWFSRYYHLSDPQVTVGQVVEAGQRLGHPSTKGDCTTGPHVHFWVQGPNGETTSSVTLSGIPTTSLGANEAYSQTNNFDGGAPPPTPTPTATPGPTSKPTQTPPQQPTVPSTPGPTPNPGVFPAGDANCDGLVTPGDAVLILEYTVGIAPSECAAAHSEINCDGTVTVADAMAVLQISVDPTAQTTRTCDPATPRPTATSTLEPTPTIAPTPTLEPTQEPTIEPTPAPTATPVATETPVVTPTPTPVPTSGGGPTARPTATPSF